MKKLEKECGFSNGYIHNLKDGKMSADRLLILSNFFGVPIDYLITGRMQAESQKLNELMEVAALCSDDDIDLAIEMLRRLKAYQNGLK